MPYSNTPPKLTGREYPTVNEDVIAARMVNELQAQVDRLYKDKKMLRQIHTKMHGCVKARFTIEPNLPNELKVGVFREAKTYNAWVRLSNASTNPKPDKKKDVRGLAIKLMDVPGDKILNSEHVQATQDFLLMNTETFFSRNVGEFSKLLSAATSTNKLKILAYALNPLHWPLLKRFSQSNVPCSNPLAMEYWSTQPYQFGDTSTAVKYYLKPSDDNKIVIENEWEYDYLRINLAQTLNDNEAVFHFYIQFQTDADAMPIEDPTVPWKSQFVKVATLTIPPQTFDTKEQMEFGENLSFNSWHSLPEHRPLGSFNRVRRRVYEALSAYRHKANEKPVFEPQDSPDFLSTVNGTSKNNNIDVEVPSKKVIAVGTSVLVNCSKEEAFNYISSGTELGNWLKKHGPIASVRIVEIIKGPYDKPGATRKVTFENGDTIQEELISYHPYANYAYRVTKFSTGLRHMTNAAFGQLWFDRMGDKTRIAWVYSYTYKNAFGQIFLWLFCHLVFKKYMQKALRNAKQQIQNGVDE